MIAVAVLGGLIVFGTSSAPTSSARITAFRGIDFSTLPEVEHYIARAGAALGYRRYGVSAALPGPPQVVILIHGASDSGPSLHRLALSLQAAGVKTYVPELRAHGSSMPHGEIRYVGQLDDHLVDLVNVLRHRAGACAAASSGILDRWRVCAALCQWRAGSLVRSLSAPGTVIHVPRPDDAAVLRGRGRSSLSQCALRASTHRARSRERCGYPRFQWPARHRLCCSA
jgi:hypothetical protein